MGAQFDKVFDKIIVKKAQHASSAITSQPVKTPVITESARVILPTKRHAVTLVKPFDPYGDTTILTTENIQTLGFEIASPDDFIGAKDTTYYLDVANINGRTTIVYDFQPLGNQGRPAAHLYYSANIAEISESLVCFSASSTLGEMRKLIEISKTINPTVQRNMHDIKQMSELIKEAKNDSASDIIV